MTAQELKPSTEAVRLAWDFCPGEHGMNNPCHRCLHLARAFDKFRAPSGEVGLLEAIAEECHEQWSGWMRYLFPFISIISVEKAERWARQMVTPYADLPENEKESDRSEARKIIAIIQGIPTPPKSGG